MFNLRRRSEEYSMTTMLMLARMPPIQSPVKNLEAAKRAADEASAESAMPIASPTRLIRTAGRRPSRSPTGPIASAPRPMPARPELRTTPSADGLSVHSVASAVAVNATTSTSKPSSPAIATQTAMMPAWKPDIGPARSGTRGSAAAIGVTDGSRVLGRRAGGTPAGLVRLAHFARVRHRRDRRPDLELAVALDRGLLRAAARLTPHERDRRAGRGDRFVDDAERQLPAFVVAVAGEHRRAGHFPAAHDAVVRRRGVVGVRLVDVLVDVAVLVHRRHDGGD